LHFAPDTEDILGFIVTLGNTVVVRGVGKDERNYSEIDQIGAVNALNGKRADCFDSEVHRTNGGVFTA
jgi:hypothetical protein